MYRGLLESPQSQTDQDRENCSVNGKTAAFISLRQLRTERHTEQYVGWFNPEIYDGPVSSRGCL
jgi:hypothetical protein